MTAIDKFEETLSHVAPAFQCSAAGDSSISHFLAKVKHQINPPASPEALAEVVKLPNQVSEPMVGFYKKYDGFTLYQDTLSEIAGIRLFSIEEWEEKSEEMREWYAALEEGDDPNCIVDGLVIGEVPQSGNYFVIPISGIQIGKIFYADHDDWHEEAFAENFDDFLLRVTEEPASLLSEALGCYTRYSDGKTDMQWIPEKYISDISVANLDAQN